MKANGAPEKIYLHSINGETLELTRFWSYAPFKRDDVINVEYTRTDAFIEKAENFLEMLGYGFIITDNITHTNYGKEQLIEDFRNYMKGG